MKLYISYHLQSLKDLTWIVWDKSHIKVFVTFTMEAFKYLFRSSTHIAHFCLWEKMLHRYCPRNIWFGWRSHLNSLWEKANSKVFCHSYFGSLPVHFQRQHSQHIPASKKNQKNLLHRCCLSSIWLGSLFHNSANRINPHKETQLSFPPKKNVNLKIYCSKKETHIWFVLESS